MEKGRENAGNREFVILDVRTPGEPERQRPGNHGGARVSQRLPSGCVAKRGSGGRTRAHFRMGRSRTTTSLSVPDSAPQTSPGRPRSWRTLAPGLGEHGSATGSFSGWKGAKAV